MARVMYDAFYPANLPAGGDLYCAYINGTYTATNYREVMTLFPTATVLSITTNGALTTADICDCEKGDYTPQTATAWVAWMVAQGRRPTVYCSRSTYTQVAQQLAAFGLKFGGSVDCWLTTLDGTQTSDLPGVVAIQYTNNGGRYDTSTVVSNSWKSATPPPTQPLPKEFEPMFVCNDGKAQYVCGWTDSGPAKRALPPGAELQALVEVLPNQEKPMPIILASWANV